MLLALAGLMIVVGAGPAQAVEYPYCMTHVESWAGAIERCDFSTMAQCQASAAGLNGSCEPNRRLAPMRDPASSSTVGRRSGSRR
ncbi:MAG: DUF3551 domain-containing protein [Pirellulales bacterium]|nr:DUF3551 domain-containing protein [Pirellulales bacterium]